MVKMKMKPLMLTLIISKNTNIAIGDDVDAAIFAIIYMIIAANIFLSLYI